MGLSKHLLFVSILVFWFLSLNISCKKNDPIKTGALNITFDFYVEGSPILYDTIVYINEAGSEYKIHQIRYFISNLSLYKNGKATVIEDWGKGHYINSHISSTLDWAVDNKIPTSSYDSVSFTLGFSNEDNISYMFVNPPEANMIWIEKFGGGYHFLSLDGKWKAPLDTLFGFAFHLGKGADFDSLNLPTRFIDNSFRVSLPNSNIQITENTLSNFTIRMNIEKWFKNPIIFDFSHYRNNGICTNQDAMAKIKTNGWNVFEFVK